MYEKHLLDSRPQGGAIMKIVKINYIPPNIPYNKLNASQISFKNNEKVLPVTNPDIPQFKHALKSVEIEQSSLNKLFSKVSKILDSKQKSSNTMSGNELSDYIAQRVFLF